MHGITESNSKEYGITESNSKKSTQRIIYDKKNCDDVFQTIGKSSKL